MNKLYPLLTASLFLFGCTNGESIKPINQMDIVKENRVKYSKEIRDTTRECLSSIRDNPHSQNYNDDNEVVKSCTEYALKLYNANWSSWNGAN